MKKVLTVLGWLPLLLAIVAVGYMLFANPGEDHDKIYFYSRIRPFGFFDFIGIVVFLAGAVGLTTLADTTFEKWADKYGAEETLYKTLSFFAMAAGLLIAWFF